MISGRNKYSLDECHLGRSATNLINETELIFAEPPRLYMTYMSPPARAATLTAAALGVPLELVDINLMDGDHMHPDFIKKNPQHTIPLLEEKDFCLSDSQAISAYLVSAYGRNDELYPKEPRRRALVDQKLHFNSSVLFATFRATVTPLMKNGETSIPQHRFDELDEALVFLDKFLEGNKWLAGDSTTIADLCCVSTVGNINEVVKITHEKYPNVYDWFERCKALPYYDDKISEGLRVFGEFLTGLLE